MKESRITYRVSKDELEVLKIGADIYTELNGKKVSPNQFCRSAALEKVGVLKDAMEKLIAEKEKKAQKYKGFSDDQLLEIQQIQRESAVNIRRISKGIGNNINQISRNLNTNPSYYSDDLALFNRMLTQIREDQKSLREIIERSFTNLWQ